MHNPMKEDILKVVHKTVMLQAAVVGSKQSVFKKQVNAKPRRTVAEIHKPQSAEIHRTVHRCSKVKYQFDTVIFSLLSFTCLWII